MPYRGFVFFGDAPRFVLDGGGGGEREGGSAQRSDNNTISILVLPANILTKFDK